MTKKNSVLLLVLDGMGHRSETVGNAVLAANTPHLDTLLRLNHIYLKAHGKAVGLPSDGDMGNSEVGHNALGSGQIYAQGAQLVNNAIETGALWQTDKWKELIKNARENQSTMHFLGLLSDGNVHAHMNHLFAMIREAKKEGLSQVRVHILLDGRDVLARSSLTYVKQLEDLLATLNDDSFSGLIASGGGRMTTTMDRYEADWSIVERGWKAHVLGTATPFHSASEAIMSFREKLDLDDQNLPSFTIVGGDGLPVGKIEDLDSVILFNFRGDRSIEISRAFEQADFNMFNRVYHPKISFAGMLEYDGDSKIPASFLVNPPVIRNTLSERLIEEKIPQFAISETQKFGHMTYFWNGNRKEKFSEKLETYAEIKSDTVIFSQRPWMQSAQITDALLIALEKETYGFLRANFPNGDMVGHTGDFNATVVAVEAIDLALGRIIKEVDTRGVTLIVTADHGNAEEMYFMDQDGHKQIKTAHTLNPVPFVIYQKDRIFHYKKGSWELSHVAATIAELLGISPHSSWKESVLDDK